MSTLAPGSVVDDKYEVVALIARGGMSRVWLARDVRLGKLWAIKEIKPNEDGVRGDLLRQAILDEADFLKQLDHPAIPRVVDIVDNGRTVFVVMDYVAGRSLGALLRENGQPFAENRVVAWGLQLCDVLAYLHHREPPVVYRDMKPHNVMLCDGDLVRLIDFGIAAEVGARDPETASRMGTPGYAPPEQLGDDAVAPDVRMDVYALGATLYSLVTGHVPERVGQGEGGGQVAFDMQPIRTWNPRLSEGLEHVLLRATQEDPSLRYQTMEELRYDLAHHEQLTSAWRDAQRRKLIVARRWAIATVLCVLVGCACVACGVQLRQASYEGLMRSASMASRTSVAGRPSEAEDLYARAIALGTGRVEPCRQLLRVFEQDLRLDDGEEHRLRRLLAQMGDVERDPAYAQLCFDVGVCYLSYWRVDQAGGAVGNAAIASMDAASPWFARAVEAPADGLSASDRRAATTYETISGFYGKIARAGREGRAAEDEYRAFWEDLCEGLAQAEAGTADAGVAEGVRARLCQAGAEALASTTYLSGFMRAGVTEDEVRELLEEVRRVLDELEGFFAASENQTVYGPLAEETRACLSVAERNVTNVYRNPVVLAGREEGDEP